MGDFPGITKDFLALPARGTTHSQTKVGDTVHHQWTYLCDKNDQCATMSYSVVSEESAKAQVAGHDCPGAPRRGIVPSGKSILEKMWDEADDALDALKAEVRLRDLEGDKLQGYIKGIAEAISFGSTPYWRVAEDVLRQLNKRWKMRQGEIPFSPTPGYRWNPQIEDERSKVERPKPAAATKSKSKPKASLTTQQESFVRESNGKFSAAELSAMFGVDEAEIVKAWANLNPVKFSGDDVTLDSFFG